MAASRTRELLSTYAAQGRNGHWAWYVDQLGGPKLGGGYVGFVRGALPSFTNVNNAAIVRDTLMAFMKPEEWSDVVGTNLGGFFNVTRPCLRPMLRERAGWGSQRDRLTRASGHPPFRG